MKRIINQITPFIFLGIAMVVFTFGIVIFAYFFLFGVIIGLILFISAWIRKKFFPAKPPAKSHTPKSGRIIDSDDWKRL